MVNIIGKYNKIKHGFQKSENSRAAAIIYQHEDDPIILYNRKKGTAFNLKGTKATSEEPTVISISTTKNLNNISGNFSIVLKDSQVSIDLFKRLTDDDWVDIIFYINNEPYHQFRGIIDEINRSVTIGGTGATVKTYTITGRCFGKIWEATPIWFSPYYNDIITEAANLRIFGADNGAAELLGNPSQAVISFMKKFLVDLARFDGPNWNPPKSMPGISDVGIFANIDFGETDDGSSKYFQNIPKRILYNLNALNPDGTLWDLAKQYSDPLFTEVYTDYLPKGDPFSKELSNSSSIGSNDMTVVIRDRPFPFLDTTVPIGYKDTWEELPIFTIIPQEIVLHNVSKSGYERYNAFYVASRLYQEELNNYALTILAPLLDNEGIKRHGLRRFDVQSEIHPDPNNPIIFGGYNIAEICNYQRKLIRDWYCLNPYFLSGTISLSHGRPDIRIGCRLHIPGIKIGGKDIIPEENYYVEEVKNDWVFGRGVRTTLGVTRGWIGDMNSYYENLNKMVLRYSLAELKDLSIG
jgi:hypothetical protein